MNCKKMGRLLLNLRKEKNMTQKELAEALHLSDRTISKWERGQGCPDVSRLPARVLPFEPWSAHALRECFALLACADEMKRARGAVRLTDFLFAFSALSAGESAALSPGIERVLAHIRVGLDNALPLEELAAMAGLSLSRFKVRFREETGVTPREYINHAKIREAGRLLREGLSVTDTAGRLGFATPNYFAAVFRKFTAKTPTEWTAEAEKE